MSSHFGSDYRTRMHVTSEALYASLTRGATWRPRVINLQDDPDDFNLAYDVAAMPIWFLPGIFITDGGPRLPDTALDTTAFNVVHELYPSTSRAYMLKKGDLEEKSRPYHVPTYGTIQAVKPDRRLMTYAFSPRRELLEGFAQGQTFVLGKKRTMFQIVSLSAVVAGNPQQGEAMTWWLELPPRSVDRFQQFEVLVVTVRYVILRGKGRNGVRYLEFRWPDDRLCLPDFYLERIPPGVVSPEDFQG